MAYVEIAKKKQAQREALIPNEWKLDASKLPGPEVTDVHDFASTCGILSPKEVEIIHTPAPKLVQDLSTGKLTSYETTLAFCKTAAIASQVVNPLTEIFFDRGLKRAKEIDQEFAKTGIPVGLLHGLPISIKDCFNVKGYDTTIGFARYASDPVQNYSVLVQILEEEGAVLYCKTNVPPGMMRGDSVNNTFGQTVNPYNRQLVAGGSSGGEGALLGMRGAPLGVGTDIAGSVRVPCAFNNLYGLKLSANRIPLYGGRSAMPGQETVPAIAGPMSNDLESLDLFCKVVIGAKPWLRDPKCIPLPWNQVQIPEKLVIGVIETDNIVTPTPPVQHAVKTFTQILQNAGHIVIPIKSTPNEKASEFATDVYNVGGTDSMYHNFEATGEEWPDEMEWLMRDKALDVPELWKLQAKRTAWNKDLVDFWADTAKQNPAGRPMDCILSPASPFSAAPVSKFHAHVLYTSTWNICDWSAGVFPVYRVHKESTKLSKSFTPRNSMEKKIYDDYNPDQIIGAPVSLQVVCQKYEDEKVVAIMKVMEKLVKANPKAF